jgi:ribonuclease HI
MKQVTIFTDGSCLRNPGGPGGWAALLRCEVTTKQISGGEPATTNNRMELMAAIMGLRALKYKCKVFLYTDSQYLAGFPHKKIKKNNDLWKDFEREFLKHEVEFIWVRGHSNVMENEIVDSLARQAAHQQ